MKRLTIVIPYRDRKTHLDKFVPHVKAYFARDKQDRFIEYRTLIIEQESGLPFNRGTLKNIGFVLGAQTSDYTCFHDVDYLPVWADYSWADTPTSIIWYGAEKRPVAPGRSDTVIVHNLEFCAGGALLVPNETFIAINGYSNDYWGWGYEDEDLRTRMDLVGINLGRRKGTFIALDHDNEGFEITGAPSAIAVVNEAIYDEKWRKIKGITDLNDGLSNLSFEIISREEMADPAPERPAIWEKVTVRLTSRPNSEQQRALGV